MAFIPDDKHYSAKAVFLVLKDLVFWADVPERKTLPADWAASCRDSVNSKLAIYKRVWAEERESVCIAERCNRVCLEFISLMGNVPGLSQIPRINWTVPSHIRVFDELADIRDSFARMAPVQPASGPELNPEAAETGKTGSHPLSPPKEKWPREEYARDAIIRLRSDPTAKENVTAFCREIAKEQGVHEIAKNLKKLLYSEKYKGLWK